MPLSSLQITLQSIIPQATLALFQVPDTTIKLHLINADYPKGRLPDQVALRIMEQPLYWAFCWASGAVMADYLMRHPHMVVGKRVLDFGCGSGVVGIAAAKAGAAQVFGCDLDPLALAATRVNAGVNGVDISTLGDWGKVPEVDVVLAADVLYDRENLPWLKSFQDEAESVLVADSRIKNFNFSGYKKIAQLESCTFPDLDESSEFRTVSLYTSISHRL